MIWVMPMTRYERDAEYKGQGENGMDGGIALIKRTEMVWVRQDQGFVREEEARWKAGSGETGLDGRGKGEGIRWRGRKEMRICGRKMLKALDCRWKMEQ
ncbi:hypothetical protein Pmani_025884 [Petrolisthes manimaculis]|uniref:Uncharacterized protein n=1 Tax=Petrolisthes manimaculis TaxID=1843537 RepID=A0AAE1U0P9_9EUCA|nr:hypothetical protein Pmani_025884 [Petrolisthes manimaculis]